MVLKSRLIAQGFVVFLVVSSGCTALSEESPTTESSTVSHSQNESFVTETGTGMREHTGRGVLELPYAKIQFSRNAITHVTNESGFYFEGDLFTEFYPDNRTQFQEVVACLYDSDWRVIDSKELGTISTGEQRLQFHVHTQEVPERIVIEHPNFTKWDMNDGVAVRTEQGGFNYETDWSSLSTPPPEVLGTCR